MIDEELYQQATDELNSDRRRAHLWARACALSSDDHDEARYLYTNLRVEELIAARAQQGGEGASPTIADAPVASLELEPLRPAAAEPEDAEPAAGPPAGPEASTKGGTEPDARPGPELAPLPASLPASLPGPLLAPLPDASADGYPEAGHDLEPGAFAADADGVAAAPAARDGGDIGLDDTVPGPGFADAPGVLRARSAETEAFAGSVPASPAAGTPGDPILPDEPFERASQEPRRDVAAGPVDPFDDVIFDDAAGSDGGGSDGGGSDGGGSDGADEDGVPGGIALDAPGGARDDRRIGSVPGELPTLGVQAHGGRGTRAGSPERARTHHAHDAQDVHAVHDDDVPDVPDVRDAHDDLPRRGGAADTAPRRGFAPSVRTDYADAPDLDSLLARRRDGAAAGRGDSEAPEIIEDDAGRGRRWSVFESGNGTLQAVKRGPCWPALFATLPWLVARGLIGTAVAYALLWLVVLSGAVVTGAAWLEAGSAASAGTVLAFGGFAAIAMAGLVLAPFVRANRWRAKALTRRGWELAGEMRAPSAHAALARFRELDAGEA